MSISEVSEDEHLALKRVHQYTHQQLVITRCQLYTKYKPALTVQGSVKEHGKSSNWRKQNIGYGGGSNWWDH